MNKQISSKFVALSVALAVNIAMIGAVAYLFSGQVHAAPAVQALATASAIATKGSV